MRSSSKELKRRHGKLFDCKTDEVFSCSEDEIGRDWIAKCLVFEGVELGPAVGFSIGPCLLGTRVDLQGLTA